MRFEFKVGRRFLLSRRSKMLAVVSVITILGVAFGVMSLLLTLSVIGGFEAEYKRSVLSFNAHALVMQGDSLEGADVMAYLDSTCRIVEHEIEIEQVVRSTGQWERAVRAGFVSTLQLVDDEEIERGLRDFRNAHPDAGQQVAYELRFDRIVAVR